MKLIITIAFVAISLSACSASGSRVSPDGTGSGGASISLTEAEKHRLYSGALAAGDFPLDTALFKEVCKKIGIFDADGNPNDQYLRFVAEHVDWGLKAESDQFRREVNSREKAREYVATYLPQ